MAVCPHAARGAGVSDGLPVLAFADAAAFAAWLTHQPADAPGIWLRLVKKGGGPGLAKPDAIDVALCHGWIDGQQAPGDDRSWLTRFTPRGRRSQWSAINRARAGELIAAGRMTPAGLARIEAARADGRWDRAYAPASTAAVPDDLRAALDATPAAAAFFATLTGAKRYAVLHRIATVKRPETRARKIAGFVAMLAREETVA